MSLLLARALKLDITGSFPTPMHCILTAVVVKVEMVVEGKMDK
jgi:hypothetical protein